MKKLLVSLVSVLLCFIFSISSQAQIVTYSFAGNNGDEVSVPPASQDPSLTASDITRGSGVTASATAGRYNSKNWTTSASVNLNDYIEFTITPASGTSVTVTTIELQHTRSVAGPKSFVMRTSLDGYASNATNIVTSTTNTLQDNSFAFTIPIVSSSAVTIRIYGYNAVNANGTWGPGESTDGLDIQAFGSMKTLPAKLFNVKAGQVGSYTEVKWSNLTESDLVYYSVEHSSSGQNFEELTRVQPSKNNGGSVDYSVQDRHPLNGVEFYRIKAVENTGRAYYSNVIKIEPGSRAIALALYPNPAYKGGNVSLQLNAVPSGNYWIRIYNTSAQLIDQQAVYLAGGSFNQSLSTEHMGKGMYIISITGAVTMQAKLTVQ